MRWLLISSILLFSSITLNANNRLEYNKQERDSIKIERYDKRLHKYRNSWANLIPTHLKTQYAGSIGLMSFGFGWDYGKRSQWETDIMFGFLPKYSSDEVKTTCTIKETFLPWNIAIKPNWNIEPLACGLFANSVLGEDFWSTEPSRYPDGYYNFNLRIRFHVFLGQRVTWTIPHNKRYFCKNISFYYELSTCDLYIISAVQNKYLRAKDILSIGFGLKAQIF